MRKQFIVASGLVALVLLSVESQVLPAAEPSIGQRVDKALEGLRQEGREVAGQLRETFEKVRASVDRLGVEGRVYARLRWDKALVGSSLAVDVRKDGVTVLRGTVPSAAAKAKAEELARDTVDVQQVANELTVAPPAK